MSNMAHLCTSQTTRRGKKTGRYASFSLRTRLRNCVSLLFTCLRLVDIATSSHSYLKFCLKFYVLLFMHSYFIMYLALAVYILLELFLLKNNNNNKNPPNNGLRSVQQLSPFVVGRNEAQRKWGACSRPRVTQQNWNLNQIGLRSWLLCPMVSNPNNLSYPFLHMGYFLFL